MVDRVAGGTSHDARLQGVLEELVARRARCEPVSDDEAMAAHPDLMPELGSRLRALQLVEEAESLAMESGTCPALPHAVPDSLPDPLDSLPSDAFEGYQLLARVHRGGQGLVYRARQKRTHRDVAIKVMREGPFRSAQDQARFDREVRILAGLRHRNIVAIHDSGVSDNHHFFVMDYIEGRPLDRYIAESQLSAEQLVELFLKVCDAVDCAHVRGVIHRDLKPGNILVDARGDPHILDFGLAKVTGDFGDGAEETVTEPGQFLGSLPWSSPEQVRGDGGDVDIRTDVYSLGLLLYHALTGTAPYDLSGGVRGMMNTILEVEPLRPSSVSRGLDSDLEAIVLKCLAKAPANRYLSAGALAEDLRRHQAGQPILARLPTTGYFLRKLIARHKLLFLLLVFTFTLLVGGVITLAVLRERARAAEQQAETQREEAVRNAGALRAVNSFLINEMLAASDPGVARGTPPTVQAVLDRAASRIEGSLQGQPLVEASIRETLARTYFSLGQFADALAQARAAGRLLHAAAGDDHQDAIRVRVLLSDVLIQLGRFDEASGELAELGPRCRRVLGADHPAAFSLQFQEGIIAWYRGDVRRSSALHAQVLADRRRVLGDEHPDTLLSINEWYETAGWYGKKDGQGAEPLLRRALEISRNVLGADHPQALRAAANLGVCLAEQRRLDEADRLLTGASAAQRSVLGEGHADTILSSLKLAVLRREQDRCLEAEALSARAAKNADRVFGPTHPLSIHALIVLGGARMRRGDAPASALAYEEAERRSVARFGSDHLFTLEAQTYMAHALVRLGALAQAEQCYASILPHLRGHRGYDSSDFCWSLRQYLAVLAARGASEEARPVAIELLDRRRAAAVQSPDNAYLLNCFARELLTVYPEDLRDPAKALEAATAAFERSTDQYHFNRFTLAQAYRANDRLPEAIAMLRRALAHAPLEHSTERALYEDSLCAFLEEAGEVVGARQTLMDTLARRRKAFGPDHVDVAQSLMQLGRFDLARGNIGEAESNLQTADCIFRGQWGGSAWQVQEVRLLLSVCLAAVGKRAEAETMLLEADSQLARSARSPRLLREQVQQALRLIRQGEVPQAALIRSSLARMDWWL